jgi:hypothetical protein
MAHGFGISMDEMSAHDISNTMDKQGYTTTITGSSVSVTNQTGDHVVVDVVDGVYIIKGNGKEVVFQYSLVGDRIAVQRYRYSLIDCYSSVSPH